MVNISRYVARKLNLMMERIRIDSRIRLPMLHGIERDTVEQHWFTCQATWTMRNIVDEY
jgi:hypothetical protein